jgi:hypothetical protein
MTHVFPQEHDVLHPTPTVTFTASDPQPALVGYMAREEQTPQCFSCRHFGDCEKNKRVEAERERDEIRQRAVDERVPKAAYTKATQKADGLMREVAVLEQRLEEATHERDRVVNWLRGLGRCAERNGIKDRAYWYYDVARDIALGHHAKG